MKFLCISYHYPGYGGAATSTLKLHKTLEENGHQSIAYFLWDKKEETSKEKYWGKRKYGKDKKIQALVNSFKPDFLICKGPYPVRHVKLNKLTTKCIYIPTGCHSLNLRKNMENGIPYSQWDNYNEANKIVNFAIENSDYIFPHSNLMYNIYINSFPHFKNKIKGVFPHILLGHPISNTEWKKRKIDVLFSASKWNRPAKNKKMMEEISTKLHKIKLNVKVIGEEYYDKSLSIGLLPYKEHQKILSQTKLIIVPSLFESASNLIAEGIFNGCNILTSDNVGLAEDLPREFIADYSLLDFINKSSSLLSQQIPVIFPNDSIIISKFIESL